MRTPRPYLLMTAAALLLAASCSVQNTGNNVRTQQQLARFSPNPGLRPSDSKAYGPLWVPVSKGQLQEYGLQSIKELSRGSLRLSQSRLAVETLTAEPKPSALPSAVPEDKVDNRLSGCQALLSPPGGQLNALGGSSEPSATGNANSLLSVKSSVLTWQAKAGRDDYARLKVYLYARDYDQRHLALDPDAELNLWLTGEPGTKVILKVADAASEQKRMVVTVGPIDDWLDDELGPKRQQVQIPVSDLLSHVDGDQMALIELQVQDGALNVEGLALGQCEDKPPVRPTYKPGRAIWNWRTQELLDKPDLIVPWLNFLRDQRINTVFLQLPNSKNCSNGEICFDTPALRSLVSRLHERKISVQALDGAPNYVYEPIRTGALKTVKNLLTYNKTAPVKARFDGLQLDVEPYALLAFHSPEQTKIWKQYLDLLYGVKALLSPTGLSLGVAIPHWLDQRDSVSQQPYILSYREQTLPLLEHLLPVADELAVMSYRTSLSGKGSALEVGLQELRLAQDKGVKLWFGLETMDLGHTLIDFTGKPSPGWPKDNKKDWIVAQGDGAESRLMYLPANQNFPPPPGALSLWHWPVTSKKENPGSDQSFARLTRKQLNSAEDKLMTALQGWGSFAGVAIHDAESFRTLMSKP